MATQMTQRDLDITEQLARIRQTSAEADARYQEALKVERERGHMLPAMIIQAAIAGGALVTAGVAVAGLFNH